MEEANSTFSGFVPAGTFNDAVYRRADGNLSFFYQIALASYAPMPITVMSFLDFGEYAGAMDNLLTADVGYLTNTLPGFASSDVPPGAINSNGGINWWYGNVDVHYAPLLSGQNSAIIEIDTNAAWFITDPAAYEGTIDEIGYSLVGPPNEFTGVDVPSPIYVASFAPEPQSGWLLLMGLSACGVYAMRRRNKNA